MNSRLISIGVFMALMLTSLLAGHYSFRTTRHEITADLNQALASLIEKESKAPFVISQDTIRAYRQLRKVSEGPVMIAISDKRFSRFLKNKALREKAFITFDLVDENTPARAADRPLVCSDTLFIRAAGSQDVLALRGYVQLSAATIFGLSDQRYPALLIILALLWLAGTEYMIRKRKAAPCLGGIYYSEDEDRFYTAAHDTVRFTPMQQQLMLLFWKAPSHSLSKEDICAALWPKKEDANDTLYTLIKRIKPILEAHTDLKIVVDRGRKYTLTDSPLDERP